MDLPQQMCLMRKYCRWVRSVVSWSSTALSRLRRWLRCCCANGCPTLIVTWDESSFQLWCEWPKLKWWWLRCNRHESCLNVCTCVITAWLVHFVSLKRLNMRVFVVTSAWSVCLISGEWYYTQLCEGTTIWSHFASCSTTITGTCTASPLSGRNENLLVVWSVEIKKK